MQRWLGIVCVLSWTWTASAVGAEEPPVLTLDEAIEIVLRENPLSKIASEGVMAAEQGRMAARSEFLPKLKTQFQFTSLSEVPQIWLPPQPSIPVINTEGSVIGGTVPTPSHPLDAGDEQQLAVRTTLEQPLFTGMALLSKYQLAALDKGEAGIQEEGTRQELIYRTHEAYFGVQVAEKLLDVADQAVAQLESHAEVARQFYEAGVIPKNDVLKALVKLADTKQKRIEAVHRLDMARSSFNTLLRRELAAPVRLKDMLVLNEYGKTMDECRETALKHNPEVLLADMRIQKADKGIVLARSGFFPSIALVGGLLHDEGGFVESDKIWTAAVQAQWTVWEWGSTYYRMKQSQVRKGVAEAYHTQILDTVQLELRQAYLTLQECKEAIEVARASIEQAEENFRITEERFKENVSTNTEVLDAQTMLAQAKVNYYSALTTYNIARASLEKTMGILQAHPKSQ